MDHERAHCDNSPSDGELKSLRLGRPKRIGCTLLALLATVVGTCAGVTAVNWPSDCFFAVMALCDGQLADGRCEQLAWGVEEGLYLPLDRCARIREEAKGIDEMAAGPLSMELSDVVTLLLFQELLLGEQTLRDVHGVIEEYPKLRDDVSRGDFIDATADAMEPKSCIAMLDAATDHQLRRSLFERWSGTPLPEEEAQTQWCFGRWRAIVEDDGPE